MQKYHFGELSATLRKVHISIKAILAKNVHKDKSVISARHS